MAEVSEVCQCTFKRKQRKSAQFRCTFPFPQTTLQKIFGMEGAKTTLKPQTNPDVQDGNITNIIAELKQRFDRFKILFLNSSSEDSWQRIAVQLRNYVNFFVLIF
jgi:hypothetical protein